MPEATSPAGSRLIKRYANRKLYDTHESRYVTLQQVAELVRDGVDVRILDNSSKEDLTNVTLAQIIYEEEKRSDSDARRRSLREFILEGRERLRDRGEKLFDSLPASLTKLVRGDVTEEDREPFVLPSLEELQELAPEPLRKFLHGALGHVAALQDDVVVLRARIEELERQLARQLVRSSVDGVELERGSSAVDEASESDENRPTP